MKAEILKIAGVKTDKEFYKSFPDEESFMKIHGKEFKKALLGANIKKAQFGDITPYNPKDFVDRDEETFRNNYLNQENISSITMSQPKTDISGGGSNSGGSGSASSGGGMLDKFTKGVNVAGKLVEGFKALKAEKLQLQSATQMKQLSDVNLEASRTRPEEIARKYIRPEDEIIQSDQLNDPYGTGTNILGKDGITIHKAAGGTSVTPYGMIADQASNVITQVGGKNAGGDLGGTIGGTVGSIWGPVGKMVGQVGGQIIGGLLDRNPHNIKEAKLATDRNIGNMSINNGAVGVQQQYTSYMEDGGTMNGDLHTGKGGYAEPISYNPYLPDNGETIMFKGRSHADGGINMAYGKNPVEVEGGEPAVKLEDGGGLNNLVVFGNLPINRNYANAIGDDNAKGMKFKNYVADLSKTEDRQNKTIKSSTEKVGDLDIDTSFDKLSFNSHKANIIGADMKLKEIADKKNRASILQEAINKTADEYGISAEDFAKGNIKKAKKGITIDDTDTTDKQKFPWMQTINSIIPYFRPTNAQPLDSNQLLGEQYALSSNQLEPVQAQTYHPQLDTPYDISLQDIRNDNQSDYRSSERLVGNNPAALAILNAQKYEANQKIGAEEFRMNQAEKDKVYSNNRNTLNDAQLKNLGILDQQYQRQEQAKSNTKSITQAALNSISDKRLKNELENKTLQTYENLYNYRYDNQGRAINMNPLAEFNVSGSNTQGNMIIGPDGKPMYPQWENGEFQGYKSAKKAIVDEKNPKVVDTKERRIKRNGAIVKAIKTL